MKTVKLYGALGKLFGKTHNFDVKDPAEAIRALSSVVKGFKQHMINDKITGYEIFVGNESLYTSEFGTPMSDREVIRIVPVITGAGNKGKIVVGIILIAIASYYSGGTATEGTTAAVAEAGLFSASTVAQIGTILVLQGISGLIIESMTEEPELADDNPNYVFDGAVNTTRQGNPVPVGYGTLRIGSQVISAGLTTE